MADQQSLVFFMILVFLFFSFNSHPLVSQDRAVLDTFRETLLACRRQLQDSQYWGGYGNLTGLLLSYDDNIHDRNALLWPFREYSKENPWKEDERDSILPDEVSQQVKSFWGTSIAAADEPAYPLNISGSLYGEFEVPSGDLKPFPMRMPKYLRDYFNMYKQDKYEEEKQRYEEDPEANSPPQEYEEPHKVGNITYKEGNLHVGIKSLPYNFENPETAKFGHPIDNAVMVKLSVNMNDVSQKDHNDLEMYGVYFQSLGALVGVTKLAKFWGNHALPHFTMSDDLFMTSKTLVSQLLNVTDIEKDFTMDDVNNLIVRAQEQCEYVAFLQFERTKFTHKEIRIIDEELAKPQGVPLPLPIPPLRISSALLYSPDCGKVLQSKNTKPFSGVLAPVANNRLRHVAMGALVLWSFQLYLLMRQSKKCRTPGQLANVASLTIWMIALQDLVALVFFLWLSIELYDLYLIFVCVAVIGGVTSYVFELRLLVSILETQANERGTTWWEILRGSSGGYSPLGRADGDARTEATDQAAETPAAPTEVSSDSVYPGSIYTVMGVLTIIANLLIGALSTWRTSYRHVFEYIALIGINSYWVPQFFRNTLKNRRRTLSWEFVVGTSALKMIPILYLCTSRNNPFRHHRDTLLVTAVAGWMCLQMFLLYLQDRLGARFWVNDRWLPEQYNYHPLMGVHDLEAGFALDILASLKPHSEDGLAICDIDCAICMSLLQIPILGSDVGKDRTAHEAMMKECMVTPCHHIFHSACLEDWMVYKLQCPVCRSALPPV